MSLAVLTVVVWGARSALMGYGVGGGGGAGWVVVGEGEHSCTMEMVGWCGSSALLA